jgi:hypothetical protein
MYSRGTSELHHPLSPHCRPLILRKNDDNGLDGSLIPLQSFLSHQKQ